MKNQITKDATYVVEYYSADPLLAIAIPLVAPITLSPTDAFTDTLIPEDDPPEDKSR